MLSGEITNANFIVFDLTQPGLETLSIALEKSMPAVIYTHVLITTSLNVSNFTNDTHVAAQLVTLIATSPFSGG
jgi:hypothetical protein